MYLMLSLSICRKLKEETGVAEEKKNDGFLSRIGIPWKSRNNKSDKSVQFQDGSDETTKEKMEESEGANPEESVEGEENSKDETDDLKEEKQTSDDDKENLLTPAKEEKETSDDDVQEEKQTQDDDVRIENLQMRHLNLMPTPVTPGRYPSRNRTPCKPSNVAKLGG